MFCVIAYDITENYLRRQVSKILSAHGRRVQKSVFELDLHPDQLIQMLNSISPYIEAGDSLRCYPLCERCLEKALSYNSDPLACDQAYYLV